MIKYISFQTEQSSTISEANVLCLGNFDGVHFAHRTLLQKAKALRDERIPNAKCGVFCFAEPSTDFLSSNPPKHLTTLEQKLKYFATEGMDFALVADFEALHDLPPEKFVNDVLIGQCACKAAVCGYNYRFGKGGVGTFELLQKCFPRECVIEIPPIYKDGDTVSSTRIRELLKRGKIKEANSLLTVPFSISAPVEHGKGLGHRLGAPTVNQTPPEKMLIPACGVYLTRTCIEGTLYYGLTNIGTHPTVDKNAPLNIETHLLHFDGDLYQKELTIEFLDYIRTEQYFESVEALQKQIQQDIQAAKARI